ncbi:hypothetical protein OPV22_012101 [Ensete ventricosum]|uniref:Uncharacterized protein n=1 Tax=Ensete ventricosum TaxID=4639 RepID=A0AAV8QWB4_ENSVE|nr:hypothetical protein OPV22_012101 [Ensete ventricosum]RWV90496.1 hypothetical protein GW17_00047296 [Ensete ventricosum]RWW43468.1 hypothetical protein BHE74_00050861 [Ensete ventricosum]
MATRQRCPQRDQAKLHGDDYVAYVTRIEKTTSVIEGPHFPNLHAIYKHKERYEEEERCSGGRFGKAMHLERFEDDKGAAHRVCEKTTYEEEEDVDSEAGEFIKRKHLTTIKAA